MERNIREVNITIANLIVNDLGKFIKRFHGSKAYDEEFMPVYLDLCALYRVELLNKQHLRSLLKRYSEELQKKWTETEQHNNN